MVVGESSLTRERENNKNNKKENSESGDRGEGEERHSKDSCECAASTSRWVIQRCFVLAGSSLRGLNLDGRSLVTPSCRSAATVVRAVS